MRLIAHRGLSERFPENTIAAFEAALEHVDVVECDVRATADGALVCVHDRTLGRTAEADEAVGELSLARVREIDPAIPTLGEVLDAVTGRAGVFLDLKDADEALEQAVLATVDQRGLDRVTRTIVQGGGVPSAGQVVIETGTPESLVRLRRAVPECGLCYVVPRMSDEHLGRDAIRLAHHADALVIHHRHMNAPLVKWLGVLRLPLYVFTVNDEARLRRIERLGAAAVFTDAVDRLARAV